MGQEDLQTLLRFFKVMADETRLKIIGLVAHREYSVEELATVLQLKTPTVSHHLSKLKETALVSMRAEGNTHLYRFRPETLLHVHKEMLTTDTVKSLVDDASADAWEQKVLRDFFEGERLKEIPASRKKRTVVLKFLVHQFEVGKRYPEKVVNEVIGRYHPDFATLRREFIGNGLMKREDGLYWREPSSGE